MPQAVFGFNVVESGGLHALRSCLVTYTEVETLDEFVFSQLFHVTVEHDFTVNDDVTVIGNPHGLIEVCSAIKTVKP